MDHLRTYAELEQREADLIAALDNVQTDRGYWNLMAAIALVQAAMLELTVRSRKEG